MPIQQEKYGTCVLEIDGHPVTISFSEETNPNLFRRVREILLSSSHITPEQLSLPLDNN
jgi:hypothetical protein